MLPIVAIVGRANVGKSTLFNRLIGKKKAITADWSGTTRDRLYDVCHWNNKSFILADTAGIENEGLDNNLNLDIQRQIQIAIEEADLLVFIVDVRSGITNNDLNALQKIQKSKKPFILVANKCDSGNDMSSVSEFYKLGVKEIIAISALVGRGTGDLLDIISKNIKAVKSDVIPKEKNQTINVAIAGRPNVGKSSLLNKLTGIERAVVSEKAGTTRDVADFTVETDGKQIKFIDTAGVRRRGKVGKTADGVKPGQIEKYSVIRSMRAISESDVVLLLIDASEGLTAQDLHIAGFSHDEKKSMVLVVNKWDSVEEGDMHKYLAYIAQKINFLPYAPVIFVSAKTGKNVHKITDLILEVYDARFKRIATGELNTKIAEDILRKPPSAQKNILPKINYLTQAGTNPPTFVFFANHPDLIHFSYSRYLENRIREHWDFSGTPITISFKKKNG
ncbi:MAG: ribosome biogenesis GTPase Der [Patescibacteria group bacterium]|jgi:GTP-binding protein|nr:ribosome biogenesis GTPase Der [Patescibacteria group bacterium]